MKLFTSVINILDRAILICSGVMEWAVEDHQEQIGGTGHTRDASLDLHLIFSNVKKNAMHVLLIELYKIKDPIHRLLNFVASSSKLFHFKQFQLLFTSKNIGRWVGMFESVILACWQVLVFCVEIELCF